MTESWLFALVAAVIGFIAISFALFITGEQFYVPSFFLVLAVVAIFEVLLIMYFGVLGMKGYVPIGIAFGFSGAFIRLGIAAGNTLALIYEANPSFALVATTPTAIIFVCILSAIIIPLVRQEYNITKLMAPPATESLQEQRIKELAKEFSLSARETEIVMLIARGFTTDNVAKKLVISPLHGEHPHPPCVREDRDSQALRADRLHQRERLGRIGQLTPRPTSAAATPFAIERICEEYRRQITRATFDPLLTSLVFAFDFVSIHPFNDGNGRMSRLITLLLMYRNGYTVGKYVSVESEIEATKETYYEVLAASSVGWSEGKNDYGPFVVYMLGVISACYEKLSAHLETLLRAETGEDSLRRYFNSLPGSASKREILEDNPTVSQRTTERILQKLQAEGFIEKVGAARATRYRKVKQREDEASTEGRAGGRG